MLFWRKPALTPTKNYENKTVCVFFQGAFDGNVKISRNIARKSKNIEILIFFEKSILKNTFLASPTDPTDRPIGRPTDPNKKWGGFAPPTIKKNMFFF